MNAKQRIKHGNKFPLDAPDEWWNSDGNNAPLATDKAHATARGIIAELQDRRGIKQGFLDLDEEVRRELVDKLAEIIRVGMLAS